MFLCATPLERQLHWYVQLGWLFLQVNYPQVILGHNQITEDV